jgi:2-methylisocitrate lyase-like PEP mutase family enzyme
MRSRAGRLFVSENGEPGNPGRAMLPSSLEVDPMTTFRALHGPGRLLVLPNAWDAGSARLIEARGATAIATTSAGLAWSRGYADGDRLPAGVLAAALAEIARVITVPLSADIEGGYSNDPQLVGEAVRAVVDAGAVGINLEDGGSPPELLCRKIEAARAVGAKTGVDLFVNARCDVYLRGLTAPETAVAETLARAERYRAAGCDGVFVPRVREPAAIRTIVAALGGAPLNVLATPGLPPLAELKALGVRRLSAGSGIAALAYGTTERATVRFLEDGSLPADGAVAYPEMNGLFA